MRTLSLFLFFYFFHFFIYGQELFVQTEPASTLAKGTLAPRVSFETYQEPKGRPKYASAIRLMYGLTRKFTIIGSISASNHHVKTFPGSLFNYFLYHHTRQYPSFPYLLEGFHLYGKYRILSLDGEQKHSRISVYSEFSKVNSVHDVAEPHLLGDNSGWGAGIILTQLYKRLAVSFTSGYIHPIAHKDSIVQFNSGQAVNFDLSFGYRLAPKKYNSYQDINVNFYLEFLSSFYQDASMIIRGTPYDLKNFIIPDIYTYNTLIKGSYIEVRPSLQIILNSATRIDIGTAYPIYRKSFLNYYPVLYINFQKYILKK